MVNSQYVVVALACAFIYGVISKLLVYVQGRRFAKAHGCKPPKAYPQAETIVGYGMYKEAARNGDLGCVLSQGYERFQKLGNTFSATIMFTSFVATTDPENIKAILATNFKDYALGGRLRAFYPLLGRGIFTTDGAHWEHSRALVRPNFARTQVADLDTFEGHITHMIGKIPRDGSTVDLQTLFFQLTFDSATEFLFGESVDILRSPEGSEQQLFAAAFDYAQVGITKRNRLGPFVFLYRDKKFDEACKRVHNFVDRFVFRALEYRKMHGDNDEKEPERYVFLNELAKATEDPKRLRDELLNILLAGRDTTAGLLSNTFHVLARRPDIWEKLSKEVDTLEGEKPSYETLRNMKYLRNVLSEALRLYPSVPLNARWAITDTVIPRGGGPDGRSPIFIPKGHVVSYNIWTMHRRKDIYGEDALEFKPERWNDLRMGWDYLPFNGGPRICVGQQFALTEASYTIVRLVQEFKACDARDDRPWAESLNLTLASGNGTLVAMTPR